MKIKEVFVALVVIVFVQLAVQADYVVIVTASGNVHTVDEFDTAGTGEIATHNYGKAISSAAGNADNGDIVLGFADGTAAVAKYDTPGTILTSGTVESGGNLLGTAIRPNGELVFSSATGWAYARDRTDVTAAPPGYTLPADVQILDANSPYMFLPPVLPVDEVVCIAYDEMQTWIRQGDDLSSVPSGYVNDHMYWDSFVTSWALTPTGDVVVSVGNTDAHVFVRDNANMAVPPAGYVGDNKVFGNGTRSKAMAVSRGGYLVYGNDSGEVFVRHVSNLNDGTISGFASTYTADMAAFSGISQLAITSNNNVIIGLHDGKIYVRSLLDIDGADVTPMTARYTASGGLVSFIPIRGGTVPSCEDIILQGRVLTGDLSTDCYVNLEDFAVFEQNWLKCNDPKDEDCVW